MNRRSLLRGAAAAMPLLLSRRSLAAGTGDDKILPMMTQGGIAARESERQGLFRFNSLPGGQTNQPVAIASNVNPVTGQAKVTQTINQVTQGPNFSALFYIMPHMEIALRQLIVAGTDSSGATNFLIELLPPGTNFPIWNFSTSKFTNTASNLPALRVFMAAAGRITQHANFVAWIPDLSLWTWHLFQVFGNGLPISGSANVRIHQDKQGVQFSSNSELQVMLSDFAGTSLPPFAKFPVNWSGLDWHIGAQTNLTPNYATALDATMAGMLFDNYAVSGYSVTRPMLSDGSGGFLRPPPGGAGLISNFAMPISLFGGPGPGGFTSNLDAFNSVPRSDTLSISPESVGFGTPPGFSAGEPPPSGVETPFIDD